MSTSLLRRLRPFALVALAAAVLAPRLVVGSSAAAFTDSASASSNTVTAATCTSTAWNTWITSTSNIPSNDRDVYNRLSGNNLASDSWMSSSNWPSSNVTTNQSGALYCDSNTAAFDQRSSGHADTSSATQGSLDRRPRRPPRCCGSRRRPRAPHDRGRRQLRRQQLRRPLRLDGLVRQRELLGPPDLGSPRRRGASAAAAPSTTGRGTLITVVMGGYTNGGATCTSTAPRPRAAPRRATTYAFRNFGSTTISWSIGDQSASTVPSGVPSNALVGTYDEFVVFDTFTTLTSAQISALYASADL
ncbi:MAG: hypothetical protein U0R76_00760 [Candidatus Nanopelagicales bacterium]